MNIKKGLIFTSLIVGSLSLTACSDIIPFEKFMLLEEGEQDVVIDYISKMEIKEETIFKIKESSKEVFKVLSDKEFYLKEFGNRTNYLGAISNYLEPSYMDELISSSKKNDFEKIIDNIYFEENTAYKESRLLTVGINDKNSLYAIVEVVSVSDLKEFTTSVIKMDFNNNLKITQTEILSLNNIVQNTTSELTEESLLKNVGSNEKKAIDDLIKSLSEESLYNQIVHDKSGQSKLLTKIEGIELKNKDAEVLRTMFMQGKGSFKNMFITNFEVNDVKLFALSEIQIAIINGNKVDRYLIIYSRVENCIQEIRIL